jgi:hypothetical protein
VSEYGVTEHDAHALSDRDLARSCALAAVTHAENFPDDAPLPLEAWIAGERALPARVRAWEFRAWSPDSSLVGTASPRSTPTTTRRPTSCAPPCSCFPSTVGAGPDPHCSSGSSSAQLATAHAISGWTTSRAPSGEAWDGAVPDEHLVAFADLYDVMNDAPLDDLLPQRELEGVAADRARGRGHGRTS